VPGELRGLDGVDAPAAGERAERRAQVFRRHLAEPGSLRSLWVPTTRIRAVAARGAKLTSVREVRLGSCGRAELLSCVGIFRASRACN
jgi:hypothetical protein